MLPCVRLSEVVGALLRVKPNRQDEFEGIKRLADPSKPPSVLVDLLLLISCQTDSGPVDHQDQRVLP